MSAKLRHLRAPALASWIADAIAEPAGEEQSGVNLIAPLQPRDGSEPIRLSCVRPRRAESRLPELRELSRELEGDEEQERLCLDRSA